MNPPVNEKLYRVRVSLKAPGHLNWTLRISVFLTAKFLECISLGGNPADLKLSSSLFWVFSSFQLSCTPFLYSWTFYPQLYLFSLAHYFLAFFFTPRSGPCFCQFHARPVLGESPRALETIRQLFPIPKNRPELFFCFFFHNRPFSFFSVAIKKQYMEIIFRHGSRFLFRISQFKIIYLNTALCKCAFCGPELFSTWATVKSYWH